METVKLNNGVEMPLVGFGLFQMLEKDKCERTILDAMEVGYRSFDTAATYLNEESIGNAITKSGLKRKDFFITTKLWSSSTGYIETHKAFNRSLDQLQTDYVDLYLIHQPLGDVYGSWRAMEELYEKGKIRAIGVSNFYLDRLVDLMIHNDIKPAINQVEMHPYCQQIEMQRYLQNDGVQLQAWSPLASGKENLFTNKVLASIGEKYNKTVAQVTLRWLIQRNVVIIPRSSNKQRMAENFNIFDFELTPAEMDLIKQLDTNKSIFFDHRDPDIIKWLGKLEQINDL
nr:aldo/keto reductase [uncultured Carboxylicivirga sp.]